MAAFCSRLAEAALTNATGTKRTGGTQQTRSSCSGAGLANTNEEEGGHTCLSLESLQPGSPRPTCPGSWPESREAAMAEGAAEDVGSHHPAGGLRGPGQSGGKLLHTSGHWALELWG